MFKSDKLEKLPPALIKVQAELKPIVKDKEGHHAKYATLHAVVTEIMPHLKAHGFALIQTTLANGRGAALETVLLHESGEYLSSTIDVPIARQDATAYGSALSYGRRYSIMALLGLVTIDEDDDGAAATITLEQRLADFFNATTREDLENARVRHESSVTTRVEKMAIRAAYKAMAEHLSN